MATGAELVVGAPLLIGVVEVEGIRLGPASHALRERCAALAQQIVDSGRNAEGVSNWISDSQRICVRRALKGGGFSPTGRNRPAHELLVNLVCEQQSFPHISSPVDINNLMSLELRVPISLLDADKAGGRATLRYGREGESYVFNHSGHVLDLKRCLLVAGADGQPLGTPIKDSMTGKVFDGCTRLFGIVYASNELFSIDQLNSAIAQFADLLTGECGGQVANLQTLAGH
jgi:DNA/RNA-binding domain of Phe-tRNA-synthetase-like protein